MSRPRDRAPDLDWSRILGLAMVATFGLLFGLEMSLRTIGLQPTLKDEPRLWAHWRTEASLPHTPRPVVLLGTSRMQQGIAPSVLRRELGNDYRVVNLSMNAASPVPVLSDLARDHDFRGIVIVGLHPMTIFGEVPGWEFAANMWVKFHEQAGLSDRLESEIRFAIHDRLAILTPLLVPRTLLEMFLSTPSPGVSGKYTVHRDRWLATDYTVVERELLQRPVEFGPQHLRTPDELDAHLQRIHDDVAQITRRGGDVFFVRMPSAGEPRRAEQKLWPRATHYDRIVREWPQAQFIHFEDDPGLAAFECRDDRHLDWRDAEKFTARLAVMIGERLQ